MINCQYCHRPTRKIQKYHSAIYQQCDYHGGVIVRYLVGNSENIIATVLVCNWREETYYAVFIHDITQGSKFRIEKVLLTQLDRPEVTEIVVSLEFLPNDITPENIMNKLPTYLLFS